MYLMVVLTGLVGTADLLGIALSTPSTQWDEKGETYGCVSMSLPPLMAIFPSCSQDAGWKQHPGRAKIGAQKADVPFIIARGCDNSGSLGV